MITSIQYLDELRRNKARSQKEAILSSIPHDHIVWKVLHYANNGFMMFNVTSKALKDQIIGYTEERMEFNQSDFDLLDNLYQRVLTGNVAKEALIAHVRGMENPLGSYFLAILDKHLDIGLTANTINKVRPGFVPVFDAMLAHPYRKDKLKATADGCYYAQPKLDGMRVLAFVKDGDVSFVSRNGIPIATIDHLKPQLLAMTLDGVFDGEIMAGDHFNDVISTVKRKKAKNEDAVYHVFDLLTHGEFKEKSGRPYLERHRYLIKLWNTNASEDWKVKVVHLFGSTREGDILEYYDECRNQGLEGVIIKDPDHQYECKRSYSWMKMKAEERIDLKIIGTVEGEGKYKGMLGAFIVDNEGVPVQVGGGISDKDREEFWAKRLEIEGLTIEIEFHEKTPDGSLRHPRYVKFRPDKD